MLKAVRVLLALGSVAIAARAEEPLFSFGVIADVQYADQEQAGARAYRDSLAKLERCSAILRRERIAFVVQLGDLVDGGLANLDGVLPYWEKLSGPRYHVLGNHDFVAPRPELLARLKMAAAAYDFRVQGWRFVVLDGMAVSAGRSGDALLAELKRSGAPNAQTWNGAVGAEQRAWLDGILADATAKGERAVIFCHFPALAESCRPDHLLWDHADVVSVLESHRATAVYLNGHDHRGGYAMRNGIHYVTLPGMVEHGAESACRVMDVFADRLVLRVAGRSGGQTLALR